MSMYDFYSHVCIFLIILVVTSVSGIMAWFSGNFTKSQWIKTWVTLSFVFFSACEIILWCVYYISSVK